MILVTLSRIFED